MGDLRPRRSFVRRSGFRDARLIVIACEGARTERAYFEELIATLVQRPSRVHVELLERDDGLSAPEHVLENLDGFRKQYLSSPDDELWAVFDYDRWGEGKLSRIASLAQQKRYRLAVSFRQECVRIAARRGSLSQPTDRRRVADELRKEHHDAPRRDTRGPATVPQMAHHPDPNHPNP